MRLKKQSLGRAFFLNFFAIALVLLPACLPTSAGFEGAAGGGGGNNSQSAENLGPSAFLAVANSTTQINLFWKDNSTGKESFILERSTDGTVFSEVATLQPGTLSYHDTGLSSGVTYTYRIKGILSGVSSTTKTVSSTVAAPSIWTRLTNSPPATTGTLLLLSDGRVMAQRAGVSKIWYMLTPNSSGSYINGTWSTLSSMSLERLYYGSNVLPDGKLFLIGGEYSGSPLAQNFENSGEIYNPVTNTWASIATIPTALFGDDPTQVLPNGKVLCGGIVSAHTYIYDPVANSWAVGPDKLGGDASDEETWVKLPDESILSYNIFGNAQRGQRYVPSLNAWYDAGRSPVQLENNLYELGPGLLLPSAKVLFLGATGHTALYTGPTTQTDTGSWEAGPDIPNGMGANDSPAAELPNGHVLLAAGNNTSFTTPTELSDYDPTTNTMTQISTPSAMNLTGVIAYTTRMQLLPTGEVLFSNGSSLWVYTSYGQPDPAWLPTVTSVSVNADGSYTLTGTQINGMSEGSTYGDDVENTTNFPIVKIVDSNGVVRYARSYEWSSQGVQTGSQVVTTKFSLPSGISAGSGSYSLYVIGSGLSSAAYPFSP